MTVDSLSTAFVPDAAASHTAEPTDGDDAAQYVQHVHRADPAEPPCGPGLQSYWRQLPQQDPDVPLPHQLLHHRLVQGQTHN